MEDKIKVGVIGCGNMACALVVNCFKNHPESFHFYCYTPSMTKAKRLAKQVQGSWIEKPENFPIMDAWLLGHKPQQLQEVMTTFSSQFQEGYIVSMLAAISIEVLLEHLHHENVSTIMPNTAVKIGQGVTLYRHQKNLDLAKRTLLEKFLDGSGKIFPLTKQEDFDLLTPFSGSGTAYMFHFLTPYIQKLVSLGKEESFATELVVQTFKGALLLLEEERFARSPEKLQREVMSKGGVTEQAIFTLEEREIDEIIKESLDNALMHIRKMQRKA